MRSSLCATAALVLAACLPSSAAVIERDWLEPGDGLLTYDTVNQREWLDVPVTLLADFPGGLDGVLNELEPGGEFEDFSWATRSDIFELAASAGIDTGTADYAVNFQSAMLLVGLLSPTLSFPPAGTARTRGYLNEGAPSDDSNLIGSVFFGGSLAGINTFSSTQDSQDIPSRVTGLFLFRAIPEPTSRMLTTVFGLSAMPWLRTRSVGWLRGVL